MSKPLIESLRVQCCALGQESRYDEILHIGAGDRTLRLDIRRDYVDYQSCARVLQWNQREWKLVYDIPWPLMQTYHDGARLVGVHFDDQPRCFHADRRTLVAAAIEVIYVGPMRKRLLAEWKERCDGE